MWRRSSLVVFINLFLLSLIPVTLQRLWSVKAWPQSSDTDRTTTSAPPTTTSCLPQKHGEEHTCAHAFFHTKPFHIPSISFFTWTSTATGLAQWLSQTDVSSHKDWFLQISTCVCTHYTQSVSHKAFLRTLALRSTRCAWPWQMLLLGSGELNMTLRLF